MSVFKVRNSPYYQYDFQIKGYRFFGSTEEKSKVKAQEVEDAKRAEADRLVKDTIATGRKPMTVEIACDRWWGEVGQYGNDIDLKRALGWVKGQIGPLVALHDVTDDMLSKAVNARRLHVKAAGRDSNGVQLYKPLSNRTVNKTVTSLLSRVFTRAKENWNATILQPPKWQNHWLSEVKRPIREIAIAEEAALDEIETVDYADLRRFGIIMGLRRGNLLVTKAQVDFELAIVRIIAKGGIPRIVPLSQEAYQILWRRKDHHETHFFTFIAQRTRRDPIGNEFVKGKRYPVTYYGFGTHKKRKWAKAGVDARIHDMRHTTGTRTLRETGNLKAAQLLLGHSDIATTAKFYADVRVEDIRNVMEATAKGASESQRKSQTKIATPVKSMKDKD